MRVRWILLGMMVILGSVLVRLQVQEPKLHRTSLVNLKTGVIFTSKERLPAVFFLDQHDQAVTQTQILGSWSLFFFGYASCPEFCPMIVDAMDKVGQSFQGAPLNFYFVSINPLEDNSDQLQEFLSSYQTPITGLTGSLDQVQSLARFFKLTVERAQGQERHIEHSAALVLMDPHGRPAGVFSDYEHPKQIAKDIRYAQYYLST